MLCVLSFGASLVRMFLMMATGPPSVFNVNAQMCSLPLKVHLMPLLLLEACLMTSLVMPLALACLLTVLQHMHTYMHNLHANTQAHTHQDKV